MNKKGFTLIELLVTIVIMGLLSGIGIISYRSFFQTAEDKYYNVIENNLLLAGNDYFADHRDVLPSEGNSNEVSLASLIDLKYIEEVKDTNGNLCRDGVVIVSRKNNKYHYEVCFTCGKYVSSGNSCNSTSNKISVSGKKAVTNSEYDVERSYSAAEYSTENIIVTFSMSDDNKVQRYVLKNTKNNTEYNHCNASNNTCNITVNKSGTYKVIAYGNNGKEISSKYINVKIVTPSGDFHLEGETKYLISQEECSNDINKKIVTINIVKDINTQYKKIEYEIYRVKDSGNELMDHREINGYQFEIELESGSYNVVVMATDSLDNEKTQTMAVNVSYLVNIQYDDGTSGTHEVVSGQNYNYLSNLPETKNDITIKWEKNGEELDINEEIEEKCTHQIRGRLSISVPVVDFTSYCSNPSYTGEEQTLTKEAPDNVQFINNRGTNAGDYTVLAHINSSQYVWSNGKTDDIEFPCSIEKKVANLTCTNKVYTGEEQELYSQVGCTSVTNGTQSGVGSWTLTCIPDDNYEAPSTCTATMNKKDLVITALDQTINYGDSIVTNIDKVTATGLVDGDSITGINLTPSTMDTTNNGTITPSDAEITSSGNDVSNAYNITYAPGTLVINPTLCNPPTNIVISTEGIVTWTPSDNCSTAQHQVKVANGIYENATSGVDKKIDIISAVGSRTVYVKALAPNSNYTDSSDVSSSTTVYTVTLTKGTGISTVTGAGNYIAGSSVTINATLSSNYTWSKWTGTPATSTKKYTAVINGDWTAKANAVASSKTYGITCTCFGEKQCNMAEVETESTSNVCADADGWCNRACKGWMRTAGCNPPTRGTSRGCRVK